MALLFAAEIGDLEQVKSLVLSCEDRFGALVAAGKPGATQINGSKSSSGKSNAAKPNFLKSSDPDFVKNDEINNSANNAKNGEVSETSRNEIDTEIKSKSNGKHLDSGDLKPDPKLDLSAPGSSNGNSGTANASATPRSGAKTFEEAKLELVNAKESKRGRTALIAAVGRGHFAVSDFLLSVGADPTAQDREGVDVLMLASMLHGKRAFHSDLTQLLLKHGADVELVDRRSQSALHYAAKRGCLGIVKLLLGQMNGDRRDLASRKDIKGRTPLMVAAGRGHVGLVRILCAHGVDANLVDTAGCSALHYAARAGREEMVEALLAHGAQVMARDTHQLSSLQIAAALGHVNFVKELLVRGAIMEPWSEDANHGGVETPEKNHRSAILLAATNGNMVTLHVLLSHRLAAASNAGAGSPQQTSLAAEIAEAKRMAALSCHDDVVRFLTFCSSLQLPQDALKIRFRELCSCAMCIKFYLTPGGNLGDDLPDSADASAVHGSIDTKFNIDPTAADIIASMPSPSLSSLQGADTHDMCNPVSGNASGLLGQGSALGGADLASAHRKHSLDAMSAVELNAMQARARSRSSSLTAQNIGDIRAAAAGVVPDASAPIGLLEVASQRSARATTISNVGSLRQHDREDGERGHRAVVTRKLERMYDPHQVFDPEDPRVKNDILRMIGMYLQEEDLIASAVTLQDEAQIKLQKRNEMNERSQHVYSLISNGDWPAIREVSLKGLLGRNHRRFLYALYRQEYLELVSRGENERAFSFLSKRLKPLEAQGKSEANSNEFRDLCYLLTCKSVHDASAFRDWDVATARDKLAEDFESMVTTQFNSDEAALVSRQAYVAKHRLVYMLQQAVAYQLEFSSDSGPSVTPKIETLLEDFERVAVPETLTNTFVGHTHNVKCVKFLGREGRLIASGSSDRTIMLWRVRDETLDGSDAEDDDEDEDDLMDEEYAEASTDKPSAQLQDGVNGHTLRQYRQRGPELVIRGHKSRIWDMTSDQSGRFLVSASGDSTVRMWDVWACMEDIGLEAPGEAYMSNGISSEYVHTASSSSWNSPLRNRNRTRLYQTTSEPLGRLHEQSNKDHFIETGHEGDIYTVAMQNDQEHIATAGYDKTVRLVNVRTNQLVRTFQGHGAAVSQVCFNPLGNLVVSVSKDASIKFWDTISGVCVRTFYQPVGEVTSVDVSRDGLQLLTSSKDSSIRLWDVRMGKSIRKFRGYQNSSLNFVRSCFGPRESLVFSGSEDAKVHVWDMETGALLAKLRGHNGPVFHAAWNSSQDTLATCSEDGTVRTWKNTRENAAPLGF